MARQRLSRRHLSVGGGGGRALDRDGRERLFFIQPTTAAGTGAAPAPEPAWGDYGMKLVGTRAHVALHIDCHALAGRRVATAGELKGSDGKRDWRSAAIA